MRHEGNSVAACAPIDHEGGRNLGANNNRRSIAVIGLGYVGLPVAVSFGKAGFDVIGLDVDRSRIEELNGGFDRTHECSADDLAAARITATSDARDLSCADFYIVTVPTPIDQANRPDL